MINVIYPLNGVDYYIDPLVKSVKWSGEIKQAARKLEVEMSNTQDGKTQAIQIQLGNEIRLVSDGVELFRGVIFQTEINAKGQLQISAFDEAYYLVKNEESEKYIEMTASQIVEKICNDFGIPIGQIDDTGYVIPRLIMRDKTLWDIMITALTITKDQVGRRYFLYASEGKLNLLYRAEQAAKWILEDNTSIIDASYLQSIEETKNTIKIVGQDDKKLPVVATVKNDDLVAKFGTLQMVQTADPEMKQDDINQMAEQLLLDHGKIKDEAKINAVGIDEIYAGKAVYIFERMTEIIGAYYVSTDDHTWENGNHTMSLTLTATDDLPTVDYKDEFKAEKAPKQKKVRKGKKGRKGKKVDPLIEQLKAELGGN
jgi:hypothetical protein